ncbi:MAG TPA: DUF4276 family protein [Bacteroidales bacterium]|nr:DUF4276 family protein [Bacteroidales bacterium]
MAKQIIIGFVTEGTTDTRFMESIIQRTFEEIAFECSSDIDISLFEIDFKKVGYEFNEFVLNSARAGNEHFGIMTLCIHADADDQTSSNVYQYKINPAMKCLSESEYHDIVLTPLVPVQMMESWLMADKELLKKEIGTNKSDVELGIYKNPEQYADPKAIVSEAIRIARHELTRRKRKDLKIEDLYQNIGQKISLGKLDDLNSYQSFKEEVRKAYRSLNYLQ